jgi:superfamily I DNA/RNA helicase
LIIIDEAQDLTPLYYELVCKIYKDNNKNVKICLLGDVHQSIYQFNNADGRYLVYSDKLFKLNSFEWKKLNLSYSFRITNEMAKFVNNCVFDYDKVLSNKISNVKPKYYMCNSYNDNFILKEILNFIKNGYKYDDIFVLAPSIKSDKTPIRNLENKIKNLYPNINRWTTLMQFSKWIKNLFGEVKLL